MSKLLESGRMGGSGFGDFIRKSREIFDAKPIEEKIAHHEKHLKHFFDNPNLQDLCVQLTDKIIEWREEIIKRDYCE